MILLEISGFLAVCCGLLCCCPLSQPLPRRGVVFGYFVIPNSFRNLYPYALFCQIPSPRERVRERGWPLDLSLRFFALFRMTCLLGFLEGLLLCPKRHLKTATGYSSLFELYPKLLISYSVFITSRILKM